MIPRAYAEVERHCRRLAHLNHLKAIVGWDEAVMMPQGGAKARGAAMAELAAVIIETYRRPEFLEALNAAESEVHQLSDWQRANLREARVHQRRMLAVDPKLYQLKVAKCVESEQAWRELRAANDWAGFRPHLETVMELTREEAQQRAQASGLSPYDALLELYEPGVSVRMIEPLFAEIKKKLPDLIGRVLEAQKSRPAVALGRSVPQIKQKEMMRDFLEWLGFDLEHGRLDESHHPFCGGVPSDVRLTTRYSEEDFLSGFMGVLHEGGHAMYEQGLPRQWFDQPVGLARGMAVHESQSLFFEMQIGRSREFFEYAAPILRRHLSESHDPVGFWTSENLFRHAARVEKSFIRVEADEVTYPAHIVMRYEIERALVEGSLSVADLPGVWDENMRRYFGLPTLGQDRNGCMQDVHWPAGLVGYFPSYSLGAIMAAQWMAAARRALPNLRSDLATGEIAPVRNWLRQNVWSLGSQLPSDELVQNGSGSPLGLASFWQHLESRYL